ELRVAKLLRRRGYHVAQSVFYIDEDESKSREIDIRALKNSFFDVSDQEHAVRHCLTIECKKSHSRPWVVFCSEPVSYDQNAGDIHGAGYEGRWFRGGHRQWKSFQARHPWFSQKHRGRAYFEP